MTLCGGVWIFCGTTQFDFVEGGKVDSELQITFTTGHTCHDAPPFMVAKFELCWL